MIPLSISFFVSQSVLSHIKIYLDNPRESLGNLCGTLPIRRPPKAFGGQVYNYLIAWAPIVIPSLLRNLKIYTRLATSGLLPKCTEDVIDAKASQRVLGIPL